MFWIQIIPLPKAEQSIIFLDTRPFTFRMAAFTARGTVRLMLLVMITASCFRLACTVASSRMAIKHEKSDTCTTMRASIAHEKGLKIATCIFAVRLTAARWFLTDLSKQAASPKQPSIGTQVAGRRTPSHRMPPEEHQRPKKDRQYKLPYFEDY